MSEIKLVKITGDFFRPGIFDTSLCQKFNVDWFFDLLRPSLEECGIAVEKVFPLSSDIVSIYAKEGIDISIENWAKIYEDAPAYIKKYVQNFLVCDLLIAYELPPFMEKSLDEIGVKYINFTLHPIRFGSDFYFSISTSSEIIERVLSKIYVRESKFELEAFSVSRQVKSKIKNSPIPDESVLICGQTYGDKVLIKNGEFLDFHIFYDQIVSIAASRKVFFKLHPMMQFPEKHILFFSKIPGCRIINNNFYEIISLAKGLKVISISSGTSIEARAFGVDSEFLYVSPYNLHCTKKLFFGKENENLRKSYSLDSKILSFEFWNWALNGIKPESLPCLNEGFIRKTLGLDWGISTLLNKIK